MAFTCKCKNISVKTLRQPFSHFHIFIRVRFITVGRHLLIFPRDLRLLVTLIMDPKNQKDHDREELEKLEAERLEKLAAAKKEIHPKDEAKSDEDIIDEQDSDGSANAFENK